MVWLLNYFSFDVFWNPWISIFNEFFFLQFIIFYFLFLICITNNLYLMMFYIFVFFIYLGIFLCILNLELFAAFLWLTESVIVFVSIIMLFYLNVHGTILNFNFNIFFYKYLGVLLIIFVINFNFFFYFENEFFLPNEINQNNHLDNFYESLNNFKLNDFYGLFNSLYYINSLEYLIVGFFLLLGSLVCVNLNKLNKSFNYNSLFTLFDFFYDFVKFFFIRKQNLINQNNQISYLKITKKKLSK